MKVSVPLLAKSYRQWKIMIEERAEMKDLMTIKEASFWASKHIGVVSW